MSLLYFDKEADRVRQALRETEDSQLYVCAANLASLMTSYIRHKGANGWSAALVDEAGAPMLSTDEQRRIEETVAAAPWVRELLLDTQKGGTIFETSQLKLTGDDVSLDKMFGLLLQKTAELDTFWKRSSSGETMKLMYETPVEIPVGSTKVVFRSKTFVVLLIAVIDTLRVSLAMSPFNTDFNRQALTLLVFIEELVTGQWRQMILTGLGFISPSGVAAGVFFKYIVNAWMLLNPGLRTQIATDLFRSSKSLLIGGVLWAASTLPPAAVQEQTKEQLEKLVKFIEDNRENLQKIVKGSERVLKRKVRTDIDSLADVTLDDIQALQELALLQPLVCSKEFRDIVKGGEVDPFMRLLFELLGVPVVDKDVVEVCGASPPVPLGDLVVAAAVPAMPAVGGTRRRRRARNRSRSRR